MTKQADDITIKDINISATANEHLPDMEADENTDSSISAEERTLLNRSGEDAEENNLHHAELDNRDDDGDLLNEAGSADDISGRDLDIPGSEEDDEMEDIGEEDEENNGYSEADTE